jgi:hypothetical protein
MSSISIPGRERKETDPSPNLNSIGAGYFSALGTPLIAGREFTRSDGGGARRVAIVNATFAQIFYDGADPLGRQFFFASDQKTPIEIIGVVKDGKYADLREKKQAFVFVPYAQRAANRAGHLLSPHHAGSGKHRHGDYGKPCVSWMARCRCST